MSDTYVEILMSTAEAFERFNITPHDGRFIECDQAAWLACVLKHLPDDPEKFPNGKWATIQNIEQQVEEIAKQRAEEIVMEVLL